MRPDRSTPRVLALFWERWPGGQLPVSMILGELRERGPPISRRTLEYALAKAVHLGNLTVVKGIDGGALYCLTSFAEAYPSVVNAPRREPLRMLQRQVLGVDSKAMRRWIRADGLRGMHDCRPGHKCIPCGNVLHRYPEIPTTLASRTGMVRIAPKRARPRPSRRVRKST